MTRHDPEGEAMQKLIADINQIHQSTLAQLQHVRELKATVVAPYSGTFIAEMQEFVERRLAEARPVIEVSQ